MKGKLLPRERVRMAVSHQEPDHPPIQFYATPEVQKCSLATSMGKILKMYLK